MSFINLGKALWEGARKLIEAGDAADAEKAGSLRAGNSGMIGEDSDGHLICVSDSPSGCPRKTYLRYLGIQDKVDDKRVNVERMFMQGRKSEESFRERLMAGLPEGYSFLAEEDIPVKWHTRSGLAVTGRPDLVILNELGERVQGIENKCISSVHTATKVLFKKQPKVGHLIQAGHYAWQLALPWDLWYSSGSEYGMNAKYKYMPGPGEPGSEFLAYWDDGRLRGIPTPEMGYNLRWNEAGALEFRQISHQGNILGEWVESIVTLERIIAFYEFVAGMPSSGLIGPRPQSQSADGSEVGFCPCGFCALTPVCEKHEGKGLTKWLKEVLKSEFVVDMRKQAK